MLLAVFNLFPEGAISENFSECQDVEIVQQLCRISELYIPAFSGERETLVDAGGKFDFGGKVFPDKFVQICARLYESTETGEDIDFVAKNLL